MTAWPVGLPAFRLDFKVEPRDPLIRSNVEIGPAKRRPRMTRAIVELSGELVCSEAQMQALELFWRETTTFGALSFTITPPHTATPHVAYFVEPPDFQWIGGDVWRAQVKLELIGPA